MWSIVTLHQIECVNYSSIKEFQYEPMIIFKKKRERRGEEGDHQLGDGEGLRDVESGQRSPHPSAYSVRLLGTGVTQTRGSSQLAYQGQKQKPVSTGERPWPCCAAAKHGLPREATGGPLPH